MRRERNLHIRRTTGNIDLNLDTGTQSWVWRTNSSTSQMNVVNNTANATPVRIGNTAQNNLLMIGLSNSTTDDADRVTITGELVTTGGGTCDPGPCDATFQPDKFTVPTIEEHAEFMWTNSHLWGVGPTPEGAPINLPKKTTGILHELEVAHIYIEQLNNKLQDKDAQLDEFQQRLASIEAKLAAQ